MGMYSKMHSVPSYRIRLAEGAFENRGLDEKTTQRIEETIKEVASHRQPTEHSKCDYLKGKKGSSYKIRVGDFRVLAELEKPFLNVLKIDHRDSVYDDVDDIVGR